MHNQNKTMEKINRAETTLILLLCLVISASVVYELVFMYKPNQNALGALASVSMDVVCIITLLVLIINMATDKGIISRTTKCFLGLMLVTVIALLFDYLTWAADGSLEYGDFTYIYTVASLCSGSILAFVFVLYLSYYLDDMYGMKTQYFGAKICLGLNALAFVLTISLAMSKNAFVFVDGHYQIGGAYELVTIIPVLTLLHMAGYSIRNVRKIGIHDLVAVVGYIFIMIAGVMIESVYRMGTTYVSVTIADIFIFVMLQNKVIDKVNEQKTILAKEVNIQHEKLESMADIIDEEKKNVEKWIHKSNTDELTGFYNRHAYEDEITLLSQNEINDNFVYVSIDVNSLKSANDTLGHGAGDELLIGACDCMRQCYGAYGKLFRTGGDEFVALIYADEQTLDEIKKDIEVRTENWRGKIIDSLAISSGYVTKKEAANMTIREMAVLADKRMYENKTKYYQRKGIDRRGQTDAHVALYALYTKILKINITDDTYQIINMDESEKTEEKGFSFSASKWLHDFAIKGGIHSEDLDNYLSLVNLEYMREYFKTNTNVLRILYRRKKDESYCSAVLEIIRANDYSDNNQTLFLYVKYIE